MDGQLLRRLISIRGKKNIIPFSLSIRPGIMVSHAFNPQAAHHQHAMNADVLLKIDEHHGYD